MVDNAMQQSAADDHVIKADYTLRPPVAVYRATPPKNLNNQIHFVRYTWTSLINTSVSGITEQNFSFTAANSMQTGWLALFDQYCCDHVTVTCCNTGNDTNGGQIPEVVTNVDFDSISVLGNIATLAGYSNSNVATLNSGKSVTRFIQPANAPSVGGFNSSAVSRLWVDSAFNSVPFYGYRSIISATPGGVYPILYSISVVWAFRNTI
jgi:hypothetical protein